MNFYSLFRRITVFILFGLVAGVPLPLTAEARTLKSFHDVSSSREGAWQEHKSDHFIVLYQKAPGSFVRKVADSAEEIYEKTMTTLGFTRYKGWTWSERVKIYIYDSRAVYMGADHYGWSAGQVDPFAKEISTFPAEAGFFDATLPHELGHIIFREAVGFGDNVPLWLEEGVAMYQEQAGRFGADDEVRALIRSGAYIPLEQLEAMTLKGGTDRAVVEAFYAEAASLVAFLINEYEVYRFERLCRELKKGNRFWWAFKKAYMEFPDVGALERAWRRHLDAADR